MPRVVLPVKVAETGTVVNVELQNPYQDDRCVLGNGVFSPSLPLASPRPRSVARNLMRLLPCVPGVGLAMERFVRHH